MKLVSVVKQACFVLHGLKPGDRGLSQKGFLYKLTRAVGVDLWQMCFGVKGDGLVPRVVTGHVALATVDTHVLRFMEFVQITVLLFE